MFNRKNTAFSARKKSTPLAPPSMTGRDRIKRATAAMFEPLETRLLMSYTFTTLANLSNTTGEQMCGKLYVDSSGDVFGTTRTNGAHGDGTIFEIPAHTTNVNILYNFDTPGPSQPTGGLIADSSGNLYGTTSEGGTSNDGAIFEFDPNTNALTTLASFNGADGEFPMGNIVMDSGGNLYGNTFIGGANAKGAIFELPHNSSAIQLLASFNGTNGEYPEYSDVVVDSSGNLYGATDNGGANNGGDVWEVVQGSGTITDLVDFSGAANGETSYSGLTMDSAGNMYGTTYNGGSNSDGTVFEVAAGTDAFTTLANLSSSTGSNPFSGLFVDPSGNIFGTTSSGGTGGGGTIFEIPATNTSTLNVLENFSSSNGSGYYPAAELAMDSSGDLFGSTAGGGQNTDGTIFELVAPVPTATQVVFTSQPTTVTAGTSQSIAVSLETAGGTVDTTDTANVTLSIASGPTGATIGGTLTEPAAAGVASFSGLTFTRAGTYTLTASSNGLTSATSQTITVSAAAANHLVIAQQPTGTTAGQSIGTVVVDVVDAYGNICTTDNSNVTLAGTSLTGTPTTVAAVNGVATFTGLSITQAGSQSLTASDGSLTSATTNSITTTPGAASQVAFTSVPGTAFTGPSIGAVTVSVEDSYGNVVTGSTAAVTVSIASGPSGGILGGTLTQSAVAGVATFSDLTLSAGGTYTLNGVVGGLGAGVSTSIVATGPAVWTGGGGDGQWNTAANWQANTLPLSGQSVDFPALSTTGTVNLATDVTVGDINFDGAGYTLSGPGQISIEGSINDDADGNQLDSLMLNQDTGVAVATGDDLALEDVEDNGGYPYALDKEGAGTLTFTSVAGFTGGINLDQGEVDVASGADLSSGVVTSPDTSVYGGGTIAGFAGAGGTIYLSEQGEPSTVISQGNSTLGTGTTFVATIGPSSTGELVCEGTQMDVTGANLSVDLLNGATPTVGQTFTVISNQTGGPISGTFNNLPEGALLTSNGVTYQISYQGNGEDDVTLTVIGPAVWTGDGGDGQWNTAANWQSNTVPLSGQVVEFPSTPQGQTVAVDLQNDVEVGNFTMDGSYTFNNNAITVDGNITANASQDAFQDGLVLNHTTTLSVGAGDQLLTTTITDAGSNDGITLDGGGTLVLDGPASYGGPTDVESGTLDIESNVPSAVTVAAGGVIEGDGSAGSITGNGGTLSLGNGSSIYTLTAGSVSLGNGTTLQEELASNNGSESDGEMAVTSTPVNLNGAVLDVSTQNGFMPAVGDVITLISNQTGSAVTGTFTGLAQGAVAMFGGLEYQVSYDGGQSGHDVTLTRVSHSPTYLAFVQQPSNAVAGGSLGTVSVEVLDAYGYLMAGDTSVVTVAGTSLRGTGSVAAVNGVATFSGLSMTQAGTRFLTATDAQLTQGTSNPFTITAGTATQLVFAQQPGNAAAGSPVGTVVVDVEDAYGNLVTTDNSAVTISGAGLGGTQTVTAVNGVATFTGLSLTQAGTHSLGATDGQLTQATSNPVTITPAAAAKLVFAQQPINAATNASVGTVVVDVEDAYGNLVTNDNSAVTISSSASLGGTQTVSAANGVATFTDLSVAQAGVFALSANDASLTGATSNTIAITHPVKITVDAYASLVSTDSNTGTLHVEAVEVGGNNSDLTYTWSILSQPTVGSSTNTLSAEDVGSPAPMAMFAINGNNAASDTPVTFLAPGDYTLQVVASNGAQSATSQVQVTTRSRASTATVAAQTTRVAGVQPISSGQSITGFVVTFTGAVDPTTAQNVLGYRILRQYTTSDKLHFAQWLFGINPGTQTEYAAYKIASAVYDSQNYSVTLTLASAMPVVNGVRLVQVIGTGAHAVLDANGKAIDGDFNGKSGGTFTYRFSMSVAKTVTYKAADGDVASLSLSGPGKIVTIMPSNTATPMIDLIDTNSSESIMTGKLRKGKKSAGYVVLDQVDGTADADVQLGDEFQVHEYNASNLQA